jgi:plasmid replication initiation protein
MIELTITGFELLNSLDNGGFTVFDFNEYTSLKSGFSKTLFRHIKQWRTIGKKEFTKEFLFKIFDLSESMRESNNFNKRVLKPIKDELSKVFKGFTITPVKVGRSVTSYIFTWQAEKASILLPNGGLKAGIPAIDTVREQVKRGEKPELSATAKKHRGRPAKQYARHVEPVPDWFGKPPVPVDTDAKTLKQIEEIFKTNPGTLTQKEIELYEVWKKITSYSRGS